MSREIPLPDLHADSARTLARHAFEQGETVAQSAAHKALYAINAAQLWRAPRVPKMAQLGEIREILESGFRGQLHRRRIEAGVSLNPPESAGIADWFESLVYGDHPFDDGAWGPFVCDHAPLETMKRIVAQRSLFFLREPDPWIHAIPTLSGPPKAGLIDLLLDEYGWGKFDHMHSTVYARVMQSLGLDTDLDHYESEVSWQYLATLNHQWMCALDRSLSRQLLGVIFLTEADSPGAMTNYLKAWSRLGIEDREVLEFYELHVHADENHRDVALREVALPVALAEGHESALDIALGIFDGRTLEADFARSEMSLAAAALEIG